MNHSAEDPGWAQSFENVANLVSVNTWIFTFWRLKKANLKGCVVKTNYNSKLLVFYLISGGGGGGGGGGVGHGCVFYLCT